MVVRMLLTFIMIASLMFLSGCNSSEAPKEAGTSYEVLTQNIYNAVVLLDPSNADALIEKNELLEKGEYLLGSGCEAFRLKVYNGSPHKIRDLNVSFVEELDEYDFRASGGAVGEFPGLDGTCSTELNSKSFCYVDFCFDSERSGLIEQTLRFSYKTLIDQENYDVRVNYLSGTAASLVFTPDLPSFKYGDTIKGESVIERVILETRTQDLTITNFGELNARNILINFTEQCSSVEDSTCPYDLSSSPAFNMTHNCPQELAQNESCQMQVSFSQLNFAETVPLNEMAVNFSGAVSLKYYNDPDLNEGTLSASFSTLSRQIQAEFQVNDILLDFGDPITVGNRTAEIFAITNTGFAAGYLKKFFVYANGALETDNPLYECVKTGSSQFLDCHDFGTTNSTTLENFPFKLKDVNNCMNETQNSPVAIEATCVFEAWYQPSVNYLVDGVSNFQLGLQYDNRYRDEEVLVDIFNLIRLEASYLSAAQISLHSITYGDQVYEDGVDGYTQQSLNEFIVDFGRITLLNPSFVEREPLIITFKNSGGSAAKNVRFYVGTYPSTEANQLLNFDTFYQFGVEPGASEPYYQDFRLLSASCAEIDAYSSCSAIASFAPVARVDFNDSDASMFSYVHPSNPSESYNPYRLVYDDQTLYTDSNTPGVSNTKDTVDRDVHVQIKAVLVAKGLLGNFRDMTPDISNQTPAPHMMDDKVKRAFFFRNIGTKSVPFMINHESSCRMGGILPEFSECPPDWSRNNITVIPSDIVSGFDTLPVGTIKDCFDMISWKGRLDNFDGANKPQYLIDAEASPLPTGDPGTLHLLKSGEGCILTYELNMERDDHESPSEYENGAGGRDYQPKYPITYRELTPIPTNEDKKRLYYFSKASIPKIDNSVLDKAKSSHRQSLSQNFVYYDGDVLPPTEIKKLKIAPDYSLTLSQDYLSGGNSILGNPSSFFIKNWSSNGPPPPFYSDGSLPNAIFEYPPHLTFGSFFSGRTKVYRPSMTRPALLDSKGNLMASHPEKAFGHAYMNNMGAGSFFNSFEADRFVPILFTDTLIRDGALQGSLFFKNFEYLTFEEFRTSESFTQIPAGAPDNIESPYEFLVFLDVIEAGTTYSSSFDIENVADINTTIDQVIINDPSNCLVPLPVPHPLEGQSLGQKTFSFSLDTTQAGCLPSAGYIEKAKYFDVSFQVDSLLEAPYDPTLTQKYRVMFVLKESINRPLVQYKNVEVKSFDLADSLVPEEDFQADGCTLGDLECGYSDLPTRKNHYPGASNQLEFQMVKQESSIISSGYAGYVKKRIKITNPSTTETLRKVWVAWQLQPTTPLPPNGEMSLNKLNEPHPFSTSSGLFTEETPESVSGTAYYMTGDKYCFNKMTKTGESGEPAKHIDDITTGGDLSIVQSPYFSLPPVTSCYIDIVYSPATFSIVDANKMLSLYYEIRPNWFESQHLLIVGTPLNPGRVSITGFTPTAVASTPSGGTDPGAYKITNTTLENFVLDEVVSVAGFSKKIKQVETGPLTLSNNSSSAATSFLLSWQNYRGINPTQAELESESINRGGINYYKFYEKRDNTSLLLAEIYGTQSCFSGNLLLGDPALEDYKKGFYSGDTSCRIYIVNYLTIDDIRTRVLPSNYSLVNKFYYKLPYYSFERATNDVLTLFVNFQIDPPKYEQNLARPDIYRVISHDSGSAVGKKMTFRFDKTKLPDSVSPTLGSIAGYRIYVAKNPLDFNNILYSQSLQFADYFTTLSTGIEVDSSDTNFDDNFCANRLVYGGNTCPSLFFQDNEIYYFRVVTIIENSEYTAGAFPNLASGYYLIDSANPLTVKTMIPALDYFYVHDQEIQVQKTINPTPMNYSDAESYCEGQFSTYKHYNATRNSTQRIITETVWDQIKSKDVDSDGQQDFNQYPCHSGVDQLCHLDIMHWVESPALTMATGNSIHETMLGLHGTDDIIYTFPDPSDSDDCFSGARICYQQCTDTACGVGRTVVGGFFINSYGARDHTSFIEEFLPLGYTKCFQDVSL